MSCRAEPSARSGVGLQVIAVAVKDLLWTRGVPTTAGMLVHRDFYPQEDATVVVRLRDAGAVLLGKLQLTEGAYSDHHPSVTPPINPWNSEYWTGISSSGPGVATAAGLCYASIASDTGGSIQWPSAARGLTGLKPTWGRVSRHGAFELAATLDHVGPMARSAADVAEGVRGLRIGIDAAWNGDDVDRTVQAVLSSAAEVFRALGATLVDVRVSDVTQAIADWVPHCAVEAAVAHEPTYPARQAEYGPVLASVIEAGRALSGVECCWA